MGNLNKVMLIGFLGQDPEKRVTSGGHSVVSVNLATTERFNDKEGNRQERTEWHRLVFWNKSADFIEQYCKKGTQLYVEGSLQTKEWTDKDGNKRYTTEIVVRTSSLLDRAPAGQGNYQNNQQGQGNYASNQTGQAAVQYQQPANQGSQPVQMNQQFQEPPAQMNPAQPNQAQPNPAQPNQAQPNQAQPKVTTGTDDFIEDDIPF